MRSGGRFALPAGIVQFTLMLWLTLCAATVSANGPNIIVIMSDDQGIEAIEGEHWPNTLRCHTPNLARLSSQGRVFGQARVNPFCSPTRAGLMSGRIGLRTGVMGVVGLGQPARDRDRLSLQNQERTIADMLKEMGYFTIMVDKWHLGWNDDRGLRPPQQGFDVFIDMRDYFHLDDPIEVGDEHMSRMVDMTIETLTDRPPNQPYALFFWSFDPHMRHDDSGREPLRWWKVHPSLLPSGEPYYDPPNDNEQNRYRAVVEALDTEIGRLLREIGVIDGDGEYMPESNAVVFYLSDNGTPSAVSFIPSRGKGTLYESGVRVPLFVFGERVPRDGANIEHPVMHTDLFDTIADIVEAPPEARGPWPRDSVSFADEIGWSPLPLPKREFAILSIASRFGNCRVALSDGNYKLIADGGSPGLAPYADDKFYDLTTDPHERINLVRSGKNSVQQAAYLRMREHLVDYWPTAVAEPEYFHVDIPASHLLVLDSRGREFGGSGSLRVGHHIGGDIELRAFVRFDLADLESRIPLPYTVEDLVAAQVIIPFRSDSPRHDETETGPLRLMPVTRPWHLGRHNWRRLFHSVDPSVCGLFDPPPHIITIPRGTKLSGIPMHEGTPVSFGRPEALLDVVRTWHENPHWNFGLTLLAEPAPDLPGDQSVLFGPEAILRLSLPIE